MLHTFPNNGAASSSTAQSGLRTIWEAIPPSLSFPFTVTPPTPHPDDSPGPSSRKGSLTDNGLDSRRSSAQSNSVFTSRASSIDGLGLGLGLGFGTSSITPHNPGSPPSARKSRRQSFPFSLQIPFSRRRLLRYLLLLSIPLLLFLIISTRRRNEYDSGLMRRAGHGFSFPTWMGVKRESIGFGYWTANKRLLGKRSREGEGGEGGTWEQRLQQSLEDIGLVPVVLDKTTMPKLMELAERVEEMNEQAVDLMLAENGGQAQAKFGMPGFWGNPDVVGNSPFDHRPGLKSWQTGKRVLFLTDYHDYLERMNTHTYEIIDSAYRHSGLSRVDIWGPGWNGWLPDLDVGENIRRRMWRIQWVDEQMRVRGEQQERESRDKAEEERRNRGIVWGREGDDWATAWTGQGRTFTRGLEENVEVGKEGEGEELMKMGKWAEENGVPEGCPAEVFDLAWTFSDIFKQNDPKLTALPCGTLLAQQLGDCHSLNCLKEWYPKASNITVTKYAFEMLDIFNPDRLHNDFNGMEMQLFGHSPDSGNEWDFFPVEWEQRELDARMFGFTGSFYPLRTVVTNAIENGKKTIIDRYQHPGYFVWEDPNAYSDPLDTYTVGHSSYSKHTAMREAFADGLRKSKICVFDASLERKMIRKYAQAFLSGCVVAGDIPTEHEDALSEFMIPLHPDSTIAEIDQILEDALKDEEELKRKAFLGFAYARKHLTNSNKITQMMRLVDKYNQGVRGYDLPYGFSLRCRSYWSNDDSWRPPWCEGYRGLEGEVKPTYGDV